MDLTVKFEDKAEVLNIRVAIIMETKKGYILGQGNDKSYYHVVGGRCKLGETSLQSAIRETEEETGLKLKEEDFKLVSVIENFWTSKQNEQKSKNINWKVQEINFIYTVPLQEYIPGGKDGPELAEITKEKIKDLDIRPSVIKNIILENKLLEFSHFIVKQDAK